MHVLNLDRLTLQSYAARESECRRLTHYLGEAKGVDRRMNITEPMCTLWKSLQPSNVVDIPARFFWENITSLHDHADFRTPRFIPETTCIGFCIHIVSILLWEISTIHYAKQQKFQFQTTHKRLHYAICFWYNRGVKLWNWVNPPCCTVQCSTSEHSLCVHGNDWMTDW